MGTGAQRNATPSAHALPASLGPIALPGRSLKSNEALRGGVWSAQAGLLPTASLHEWCWLHALGSAGIIRQVLACAARCLHSPLQWPSRSFPHSALLGPDKSLFLADRLPFLGHMVTPDGREPELSKVAAMLTLPTPTNVGQL
jgi:hypothetical protein